MAFYAIMDPYQHNDTYDWYDILGCIWRQGDLDRIPTPGCLIWNKQQAEAICEWLKKLNNCDRFIIQEVIITLKP